MDQLQEVNVMFSKLRSTACFFAKWCWFFICACRRKRLLFSGVFTKTSFASQTPSSSADTEVSESLLWQHFSGLPPVLSSLLDIVRFQENNITPAKETLVEKYRLVTSRVYTIDSVGECGAMGSWKMVRSAHELNVDWNWRPNALFYLFIRRLLMWLAVKDLRICWDLSRPNYTATYRSQQASIRKMLELLLSIIKKQVIKIIYGCVSDKGITFIH